MGGGVGRSNGNSVISGASTLPTPIIQLMPCEIATEPLNVRKRFHRGQLVRVHEAIGI